MLITASFVTEQLDMTLFDPKARRSFTPDTCYGEALAGTGHSSAS